MKKGGDKKTRIKRDTRLERRFGLKYGLLMWKVRRHNGRRKEK